MLRKDIGWVGVPERVIFSLLYAMKMSLRTLYNVLLRIARNLLETRKNIKFFLFEEKNSKWPIFQNGRFSKWPILEKKL